MIRNNAKFISWFLWAVLIIFLLGKFTPTMHSAARNNQTTWLKFHCSLREDVNKKESESTPLHYAAENNSKDAVEILIQNKAAVNVKNDFGETPLHNATLKGNFRIVELLVKNGANVNAKNDRGQTPLEFAAAGYDELSMEVMLPYANKETKKVVSEIIESRYQRIKKVLNNY